jgi:hypothetical protein
MGNLLADRSDLGLEHSISIRKGKGSSCFSYTL